MAEDTEGLIFHMANQWSNAVAAKHDNLEDPAFDQLLTMLWNNRSVHF